MAPSFRSGAVALAAILALSCSAPDHATPAAVARAEALKLVRAESARAHLQAARARLGLAAETTFSLRAVEVDELGMTHARFRQLYRGLPVLGAEAISHTDPSGEERPPTLAVVATGAVDTAAAVDPRRAIAAAEAGQAPRRARPSTAQLIVYPERVLRELARPRAGHLPNA